MSKITDMIGNSYYKLQVYERCSHNSNNVIVKCECGNTKSTNAYGILKGRTKSCGCLTSQRVIERNKNSSTHGLSRGDNKKLYDIYKQMIRRCHNEKSKDYKHYGERGITVCEEWINDIHKFVEWSNNNGYQDGLSIDRINTDGNYDSNNCRWITLSENIGKRNTEYANKNKK